MIDDDIAHALTALTARVMALEGALALFAPHDGHERALVFAILDNFERELLDRYVGLPAEETFLDLLCQSFVDARMLLETGMRG